MLTGAGLRITGTTPDATYVEIVEIPGHPVLSLAASSIQSSSQSRSSRIRSSTTSSSHRTRIGSLAKPAIPSHAASKVASNATRHTLGTYGARHPQTSNKATRSTLPVPPGSVSSSDVLGLSWFAHRATHGVWNQIAQYATGRKLIISNQGPAVISSIQRLQRLETVSYSMDKIVESARESEYLPDFLAGDRLAARGSRPGA